MMNNEQFIRSLIRDKVAKSLSSDFLEKRVTNPETGNKVKVKTLKSKPKDTSAYKLYEKLRDQQKKDTKSDPPKEVKPVTPKQIKPLFSAKETENLPTVSKQSYNTPEKIFQQAEETHQKQVSILSDIAKGLGARVLRADQGEPFETDTTQPVVIIGPLKKMERSKEKVATNFGGDWSRLTDVVRASVAVDTYDDLESVVSKLKESGIKLASKPNDRFSNPTEAGYRDMCLFIEYDNGHVSELQLHVNSILEAKDKGHKLYEIARSIGAKKQREGDDSLTQEELAQLEDVNKQMKDLYDEAWDKALSSRKKKGSFMEKAARQTKYYLFGDVPAKWEHLKFPVQHVFKGRNVAEEVVYDLEKFFQDARPIRQNEYESRLKAMQDRSKNASLRVALVKVAYENPDIREYLLPLLEK